MNKYQNGKIYKLVNTEGTLCYIGSTTQTLAKRKSNHHESYKCWKNGKTNYRTSFKIFDDDEENCQIVLLDAFPCNNREELEKRERYYIENNNCVNKYRPTRTIKEWIEGNKEKIQQYQKQYQNEYYQENKDIINKNRKVQHKCVCGGNYSTVNKSNHIKTLKHLKYMNSIKTEQDELEKLEAEFNKI